jgi:hypothetical protein
MRWLTLWLGPASFPTRRCRSRWWLLARNFLNSGQHDRQFVSYSLVRKTQHSKSGRNMQFLALGVVLSLLQMHPTIDFNGEAPLDAAEVDHERPHGMLPSKLQPC